VGKRLLVFGGCGFVGGTVAKLARECGGFETVAIVGSSLSPKPGFEGFSYHQADITNYDQVKQVFENVKPTAVINAAAMSNIDRSETEKDLAYKINVEGSRNLAQASAEVNAKYLFLSSDAVFDGKNLSYSEDDVRLPVNYYGGSKVEAEKAVLAANPHTIVARVSLVLGLPRHGGNSFLANVKHSLETGKEVICPVDEVRTPVDVHTLSESILELIDREFKGTFHIGSTESIDRYELTKRAAMLMGHDHSLIKMLPASNEPPPGRAPRHKNGILNVKKAQSLLKTKMLNVTETLERAVTGETETKMKTPEIKMELEVAYGTTYGLEEATAVLEVIQNMAPSCGKKVKQFEDEFAAYCGTKYAVSVTSATTGLTLTGIAAGIQPGDEVITTPISWIATSSAFSNLGAKIVFCDVDPKTLNLDPAKLEACITDKTKLIVPVHLYGQCAPMDKIMEIARRHDILVAEDCAHNPGGEYKGKRSGALGDMGVFSFHQQKNMSTLGEGGMVTMNSKELFEKVLSYRSLCCRMYGPSHKYLSIDESKHPMGKKYWELHFDDVGYNFRMTDAQAACGIAQLKKLDRNNQKRIELAHALTERLAGIEGLTVPHNDTEGKHVFHLYMIQLEKEFPLSKEDFMWKLYTEKGIKAWSHYLPIHLTNPYRKQGHFEGECPVAEQAFKKYVTLPIHPRLTLEAIDYLAQSIRSLV